MPVIKRKAKRIEIVEPPFAIEDEEKAEIIYGYVDCHRYELDGSQTILIRTEPRESVKEFIHNELTEKIGLRTK